MEINDAPRILTFGRAGEGKSTFLNYLFQGEAEARRNPMFQTSEGGKSCTLGVAEKILKVHGSNQTIHFFDTPGVFSGDMKYTDWFNKMQYMKGKGVNAILWVVDISNRTSIEHTIISQIFDQII